MIKKVIVAVLICILALSFCVDAKEYYNSDEVYAQRMPAVKNQEQNPDCWSFAAIDAAEHSLVVKNNAAFNNENQGFSPYHMVSCMNITRKTPFNIYTRDHIGGGNRECATAYFSRSAFSGPVTLDSFKKAFYSFYLDKKMDYHLLFGHKKEACLTRAHFITDQNDGSSYIRFEEDGISYGRDEAVIARIKDAIVKYGAVSADYYAYERDKKTYYNPQTGAYCAPWEDFIKGTTPDGNCVFPTDAGYGFTDATNHTVTVVGWDDNYPCENFKNTPISKRGNEVVLEDGAWIVKNSWGEGFGNGGYEYISYMDPCIGRNATAYEFEYLADYTTKTHAQKGLVRAVRFPDTGYGVCLAERFDNARGTVNAIGIYVCDESPTVEIVIDTQREEELKRFTRTQFESNRVALKEVGTGEKSKVWQFDEKGYYMLLLDKPVSVENGFDLYVKYTVDEKSDILVGAGNNSKKDAGFTEKVSCWAHITGNGHVHQWKNIDYNWSLNVYMTENSFRFRGIEHLKGREYFLQ